MCDDLISRHYLNTAPTSTLHSSPQGTTHFTLHPSGNTWLIIQEPVSVETLEGLRPKWNTLNSYDPKVAEWALANGHRVDMLRVMKKDVSGLVSQTAPASESADGASTPPHSVPPPAGYASSNAISTKAWFLATYPLVANTIHKASEQIFSISDVSRSIPQRAGWLTALPDIDTGRAYISSLQVLEAHRRKGLAGWLVGQVERWWSAGGGKEVWLTVFEKNAAGKGLYESLGFETVNTLAVISRVGHREGLIHDGCD